MLVGSGSGSGSGSGPRLGLGLGLGLGTRNKGQGWARLWVGIRIRVGLRCGLRVAAQSCPLLEGLTSPYTPPYAPINAPHTPTPCTPNLRGVLGRIRLQNSIKHAGARRGEYAGKGTRRVERQVVREGMWCRIGQVLHGSVGAAGCATCQRPAKW